MSSRAMRVAALCALLGVFLHAGPGAGADDHGEDVLDGCMEGYTDCDGSLVGFAGQRECCPPGFECTATGRSTIFSLCRPIGPHSGPSFVNPSPGEAVPVSRMLRAIPFTSRRLQSCNLCGDLGAAVKESGVGATTTTACANSGLGCNTGGIPNCRSCLFDRALALSKGFPDYVTCDQCVKTAYCASGLNYPGCSTAPSPTPATTPKPSIKPTKGAPTATPPNGNQVLGYVSAYSLSTTSMVVAWNAVPGSPKYNIYVNGGLSGTTSTTNFALTELAANTLYQIQINVAGTTQRSRVLKARTLSASWGAGEAAITTLMAQMTTQEKVDQLHGTPTSPDPTTGNFVTPTNTRLNIPGFQMQDGSHGVRGGMLWPTGIGCAATWNPSLEEEIGQGLGNDHRGLGDDVGLGPAMDICRDQRWGRCFESYGEDPYLQGKMAAAKVRGMQASKCISTSKHFVAYNIESGRGNYKPIVPERTMREIYALPFEYAVKEGGTLGLMSAYTGVNGTYMTSNTALQQYMAKDDWGFKGMIVSDWGAAHSTLEPALGGMDVQMPSDDLFGGPLLAAVQTGTVPMHVLNDKVRRVLRVKYFLGALSPGYNALIPSLNGVWTTAPERAVVRRAGQEAMVLAKNNGLLPLSKTAGRTVAIVGPYADKVREGGGGSSFMDAAPPTPETPRQAIMARCTGCTFVSDWATADQVIAIVGVRDTGEDTDKTELGLFYNPYLYATTSTIDQEALLAPIMAAKAAKTVVILTGGSAAVKSQWSNGGAVVIALYPGQLQGLAMADVLFGDYNPAGRLPITYVLKGSDLPPWGALPQYENPEEGRGWTYFEKKGIDVLFPFGHGLSYTKFTYSALTIPATVKRGAGGLTVKVTVTNTGGRGGDEVVQLYVGQRRPTVPRRIKDLRGFKRVNIAAGAAVTVSLPLTDRDVSYWSPAASAWVADLGIYDIKVGASSRDIRVQGSFKLIA